MIYDCESFWGQGAEAALTMGEGEPQLWANAGLRPLSRPWLDCLSPIANNVVGFMGKLVPTSVSRVIGGFCIYRSEGEVSQLPLSMLWEILSVVMVASKLGVPCVLLPPIAEEAHRMPNYATSFYKLGRLLNKALPQFAACLDVELTVQYRDILSEDKSINLDDLYGLFYPFSQTPELQTYPLGRLDEYQILRAHESYCARYQNITPEPTCFDLYCEGLHVVKSVRVGIRGTGASYLATVPLPAYDDMSRPMTDLKDVPMICETLPPVYGWWPDQLVQEMFGMNFEELRHILYTYLSLESSSVHTLDSGGIET